MTSAFSQNIRLEEPANGDDVDSWDVPVNANMTAVDAILGATTTINATAASGTVALTSTQYRPRRFIITGTLTADVNYQLPLGSDGLTGVGGSWSILNNTTGAHVITFSSIAGGASITLAQGAWTNAACDGTNVYKSGAAAGANADITSLTALGLTGLLKGQGAAAAVIAATAGTDYVKPDTATTITGKQTFTGTTAHLAVAFVNAAELATISATAATGTIAYYVSTQSILYYTSNAAANWTVNLTFASTPTTLDSAMSVGDVVTVVHAVTQGASPFYNNVVQVDGTTSGVTTKWQGAAPSAGNASGIDVYEYAIIKTGSAAFTVLASQTQFK